LKKKILKPKKRVWPKGKGGTEDSTEGLIDLCEEWIRPFMVGAEIGCFAGVSTEVFVNYAQLVYAVEPWEFGAIYQGYADISIEQLTEARKKFEKLMKKYPEKIILLPTYSVRASVDLFVPLDFVYIDGAHDKANAIVDIILWGSKVKPGGLVMGHDYHHILPVLEFLNLKPIRLYKDDSWVVMKPN
jgi:hypothetical protein